MDLADRLLWMAVGGALGFVLGYIVRSLKDIRKRVEHMEDVVTNDEPAQGKHRGEDGFMQNRIVADVMVLLVVLLSVFASFQTAKVNSELEHTLDCISQYNSDYGGAIKSRDQAIKDGTQSEINLWLRYEGLYKQAQKDPKKIPALQEKLNKAIKNHRASLEKLQKTREAFPYPNPNILENCEEGKNE